MMIFGKKIDVASTPSASLTRKGMVICCVGISGILLLGILMLDILLFIEGMGEPGLVGAKKSPELSAGDIDEVISLLNAREQKFNDILASIPPVAAIPINIDKKKK